MRTKNVIRAYAGDFNEAHREGCRFVDQMSGVDAIPSDIVISTNGGYPLDQNIYQSVKGMTAAEASCNPGGVIIMVSSCIDGHGGQSLYDTFASGGDKNVIMQRFLDTPRDKTIPASVGSTDFVQSADASQSHHGDSGTEAAGQ